MPPETTADFTFKDGEVCSREFAVKTDAFTDSGRDACKAPDYVDIFDTADRKLTKLV